MRHNHANGGNTCAVCGKTFGAQDLVAAALVNWRWSDDPSVSPLRRTSTSDMIKDASVPTDTRWSVSLHYRYDA